MKEKDIVDFTKFNKDNDGDYIDEKGEEVGCEICYTHKKAYEYFDNDLNPENMEEIPVPRCPVCGKPMVRRNAWTSDGNYSQNSNWIRTMFAREVFDTITLQPNEIRTFTMNIGIN